MPTKKKNLPKLTPLLGLAGVVSYILMTIARWLHPATFSVSVSLLVLLVSVVLLLLPLLKKNHPYE